MNEQIRELVKKAGGDFWQRIESDGVLNKEAYITFDPPESLEKFVDLLVKDCMSITDELKAQYFASRKSTMDFDEKNIYAEGEAACDILRYKMKKQFGVEE